MKKFIIVTLFIVNSLASQAGTWERIDSETLRFLGTIKEGEFERFNKKFDSRVKTLLVTSGGGDAYEAIDIAEVISDHDVTVVAKTWCLSSCANYLFPAGRKQIIDSAIVGYHGGVNACFMSAEKQETSEKDLRKFMIERGFTQEQIEKSVAKNRRIFDEKAAKELNLFKKIGVNPKLFEVSCTLDKGARDGKSYSYLLPNSEEFRNFGMNNVEGSQDLMVKEWFPGDLHYTPESNSSDDSH